MVSIKSEEDGTIVWTGCIDSIEEAGSIYLVGRLLSVSSIDKRGF